MWATNLYPTGNPRDNNVTPCLEVRLSEVTDLCHSYLALSSTVWRLPFIEYWFLPCRLF